MKQSPFGENSINKNWAKSVTLEEFTKELLQCELYSKEHIEAEWYRINEISKSVEVAMPPTFPLNTSPNGKLEPNSNEVKKVERVRTGRRNNARQKQGDITGSKDAAK